ncbi:pleckstrin homology domain-containing family G member 5-like isoform X1 [Lethenteron reissneri]|uniref:pleckstrin homology domain-containing family G member 5-like isoform X1 n=1 Tax=Lethenteron reissneri TaxID=7753 RepID=UPI002AB71746|nr:pleckstrin homology domain-containing family G member 5-like isoform X1 [Lethenteron reissneri]
MGDCLGMPGVVCLGCEVPDRRQCSNGFLNPPVRSSECLPLARATQKGTAPVFVGADLDRTMEPQSPTTEAAGVRGGPDDDPPTAEREMGQLNWSRARPSTVPPKTWAQEWESEERYLGVKVRKKKGGRRHYTDDPGREWFTLKFDLPKDQGTEVVPAVKEKSLRETLSPIFLRRGLSLGRVDVFLDHSSTPLCLDFETFPFGGRHLAVKAKVPEGSSSSSSKSRRMSVACPSFLLSSLRLRSVSSTALNGPPRHPGDRPGSTRSGRRPRSEQTTPVAGRSPSREPPQAGEGGVPAVPAEPAAPGLEPSTPCRRRKNMASYLGDVMVPLEKWGPPEGAAPTPAGSPVDGSKVRQGGARIGGIFGPGGAVVKDSDRLEILRGRLSAFELHGLPRPRDAAEWSEPLPDLEASWTQICHDPKSLSHRSYQQQEATWELFSTEMSYMRSLQLLCDLFISCLLNLQETGLLREVQVERVFVNVPQLLALHKGLWREQLAPALQRSRSLRAPLRPADLLGAFTGFRERFEPYLQYYLSEQQSTDYTRSLIRDNEVFRIYLTWAESQKPCSRLKLLDMLASPHQRLTKYPLLLRAMLHKTDAEGDRTALLAMAESVEGFIAEVNAELKMRQEQRRVAGVAARIEAYEVVEPGSEEVDRILLEFSCLDLMGPIPGVGRSRYREVVLEGPLKMRDGRDRLDVHCVLFTDLLLVSKWTRRGEKTRIIRPPMAVDRLVCRELRDPGSFLIVYLTEYGTVSAALAFQASGVPAAQEWVEALSAAQVSLASVRAQESERRRLSNEPDLSLIPVFSLVQAHSTAPPHGTPDRSMPFVAPPRLVLTTSGDSESEEGPSSASLPIDDSYGAGLSFSFLHDPSEPSGGDGAGAPGGGRGAGGQGGDEAGGGDDGDGGGGGSLDSDHRHASCRAPSLTDAADPCRRTVGSRPPRRRQLPAESTAASIMRWKSEHSLPHMGEDVMPCSSADDFASHDAPPPPPRSLLRRQQQEPPPPFCRSMTDVSCDTGGGRSPATSASGLSLDPENSKFRSLSDCSLVPVALADPLDCASNPAGHHHPHHHPPRGGGGGGVPGVAGRASGRARPPQVFSGSPSKVCRAGSSTELSDSMEFGLE